jgi:hypothetical protein
MRSAFTIPVGAAMFIGGMALMYDVVTINEVLGLAGGFVCMMAGGLLMAVEMSRW